MHSALTYTMLDIGGSLWGTVVFAAAMLAPGYLAGWLLGLAGFRDKSCSEQLAWSVVLSAGIGTIVIVAATWVGGVTFAAAMLALISIVAAYVYVRNGSAPRPGLAHVLLMLWTALVILSLVDMGIGARLGMSVTTFDHSVRVPFVDAVMRTGVVPVNPLYWPGHDAPLRYYYFWYVTCGVIAKLAHISARQSLIASCVWPAVAVAAMLALYGKHLLGWRGAQLRTRTGLAVAFTAITGIDVLIALANWLAGGVQNGDMEWWSVDQVTSWIDTFLWVPHHVVALVCCLFSFLLIWMAREQARRSQKLTFGIIAGLSFASAFGLSTFVAMGFTIVMGAWLVRVVFTTRDRSQLSAVAVASVVACIVLVPYVLQLLHQTPAAAGGEHGPRILAFEVRRMLDPDILATAPFVVQLAGHRPFIQMQIAAFLLMTPSYAIELGFFAVVLWRYFRMRERSEGERTLLFLLGASLASVSFLRSTVIATNDYGVRATLIAQFFLLLLAVRVWEESRTGRRFFLRTLAVIGVCGSVYQVVTLRTFLPRQQARGNILMRDLAERNYAMRDAYTQLDARVPRAARLQYDAPAGGYFDYTHTLHAGRQIVAAGATGNDCNTGFGGEVSACAPIRAIGAQLYRPPVTLPSADAAGLCLHMGAQYLVATRWDPIWQDPAAWPWQLPAIVATPSVRIVSCSKEHGLQPS